MPLNLQAAHVILEIITTFVAILERDLNTMLKPYHITAHSHNGLPCASHCEGNPDIDNKKLLCALHMPPTIRDLCGVLAC